MTLSALRTNGIVNEFTICGAEQGVLAGTSFLAKDIYDVEGHVTSAGNPDWLRTHESARATAKAITTILEAGANLVGKSSTDELAYAMDGINAHYGIPINGQYKDRIPGGSSSGSASAVSTGLVDFALGTDTAGSVRVPASYCGIYGFRPSHGRVSTAGVLPLAPSFDTVAWMTRSPELLKTLGQVLLDQMQSAAKPKQILIAKDVFAAVSPSIEPALLKALTLVRDLGVDCEVIQLGNFGWKDYVDTFRMVQSHQAWKCHGEWIERVKPNFGPGVRQRFEFAKTVTEKQYETALALRNKIVSDFAALLSGDRVLCLPTTWDLPPLLGCNDEELQINRQNTMSLSVIAPLAGVPQVTMPTKLTESTTTGISFAAAAGNDILLLEFCQSVAKCWL